MCHGDQRDHAGVDGAGHGRVPQGGAQVAVVGYAGQEALRQLELQLRQGQVLGEPGAVELLGEAVELHYGLIADDGAVGAEAVPERLFKGDPGAGVVLYGLLRRPEDGEAAVGQVVAEHGQQPLVGPVHGAHVDGLGEAAQELVALPADQGLYHPAEGGVYFAGGLGHAQIHLAQALGHSGGGVLVCLHIVRPQAQELSRQVADNLPELGDIARAPGEYHPAHARGAGAPSHALHGAGDELPHALAPADALRPVGVGYGGVPDGLLHEAAVQDIGAPPAVGEDDGRRVHLLAAADVEALLGEADGHLAGGLHALAACEAVIQQRAPAYGRVQVVPAGFEAHDEHQPAHEDVGDVDGGGARVVDEYAAHYVQGPVRRAAGAGGVAAGGVHHGGVGLGQDGHVGAAGGGAHQLGEPAHLLRARPVRGGGAADHQQHVAALRGGAEELVEAPGVFPQLGYVVPHDLAVVPAGGTGLIPVLGGHLEVLDEVGVVPGRGADERLAVPVADKRGDGVAVAGELQLFKDCGARLAEGALVGLGLGGPEIQAHDEQPGPQVLQKVVEDAVFILAVEKIAAVPPPIFCRIGRHVTHSSPSVRPYLSSRLRSTSRA